MAVMEENNPATVATNFVMPYRTVPLCMWMYRKVEACMLLRTERYTLQITCVILMANKLWFLCMLPDAVQPILLSF
jgi:hypothetical protein